MQESGIRLHKWMAEQGLTSRREAERWIAAGRVSINGQVVKDLGTKIDAEKDRVEVDGQPVEVGSSEKSYLMLNKPVHTLCSRSSENGMQTIYQLPAVKHFSGKLESVGRLDFMSEGLIILTNDGELAHKLTHPSFLITRTYEVWVDREFSSATMRSIRSGVELDDGPVSGIHIEAVTAANPSQNTRFHYSVNVSEGRNRLIRRLMEKFDARVLRLLRSTYGTLSLDAKLRPGECRPLSFDEVRKLKASVRK